MDDGAHDDDGLDDGDGGDGNDDGVDDGVDDDDNDDGGDDYDDDGGGDDYDDGGDDGGDHWRDAAVCQLLLIQALRPSYPTCRSYTTTTALHFSNVLEMILTVRWGFSSRSSHSHQTSNLIHATIQ